MSPSPLISVILVPQGAEYQAVCRGLRSLKGGKPKVVALPVGPVPVIRQLKGWVNEGTLSGNQAPVLVMGLCGSLNPTYPVGTAVGYRECLDTSHAPLICDPALTAAMVAQLPTKIPQVRAFTSDRLIWSSQEKSELHQRYQADVVDMEGFAIVQVLTEAGISVAMLRVVSDNAAHNIPDLTAALSAEGILRPLPLTIGMLRQPLAALRLIRGSLQGLKVLETISRQLSTLYH